MPTGYTEDIKNGISFETYAMNCARAFGACVDLRDDPGGGECIPTKFEPKNFYVDEITNIRSELLALRLMTPSEIEIHAAKDYDDKETRRIIRLKEIAELRAAYEAMLMKVNAWVAPTPEHAEYHKFMRQQIVDSIKFDCDTDYYSTPTIQLSGDEWLANKLKNLTDDLNYYIKMHDEDVKRAQDKTTWITALRVSLL